MPLVKNGEMYLFGVCGWPWDDEGFTAAQVINALADIDANKPLTVRINSAGGYTEDGFAIYRALRRHTGEVTTVNEAVAASVASLIFMAGDERIAEVGSQTMIHDPMFELWMSNPDDMRKAADVLDSQADGYAGVYAERSGQTPEAVRAMMKEETWLSSAEALELGFATASEEITDPAIIAMFPYEIYQSPPPPVVAMAHQQGWTSPTARKGGFFMADRKSAAVTTTTTKETAMSDKNGSPDTAALDAARDEATKAAQARMQAIMQSDAAKGRTKMAEHLAFNTSMAADEAVALMETAPVEAVSADPVTELGNDDQPDPEGFERSRMQAAHHALPGAGQNPPPNKGSREVMRKAIDKTNKRRA